MCRCVLTVVQSSLAVQVAAVLPSCCGKSTVTAFVTKCLYKKLRYSCRGNGAQVYSPQWLRNRLKAPEVAHNTFPFLVLEARIKVCLKSSVIRNHSFYCQTDELLGGPLAQSYVCPLGAEQRAMMCSISAGGIASRLLRAGSDGPLDCDQMYLFTAAGVQRCNRAHFSSYLTLTVTSAMDCYIDVCQWLQVSLPG